MKTYCKGYDLCARESISVPVYRCLDDKYTRWDTLNLLSEHSDRLSPMEIKHKIKTEGKHVVYPIVEKVIDTMQSEIINRNLILKPITYRQKTDPSSGKLRDIGIQNVKQQLYDYVAVEALKPFLRRIGEYQCASIPGRGQSYGVRAIRKWMRNKSIRYAGKCDIRKCYESIDRDKLMKLLRKYVKNDAILWLVETLIYTFKNGLSIGSYLSQFLCNLYLSNLYHHISENMYTVRRHRRGNTQERINLVEHVLFQMDDILILCTSKKYCHKALKLIKEEAAEMGLDIKVDWRAFDIGEQVNGERRYKVFIDIMGVRIYRNRITIRRRSFLRIRRVMKKAYLCIVTHKQLYLKLAQRVISYWGILKSTNSFKIIKRYNVKLAVRISKEVISHENKGEVLRQAATA